MIRTQNICRIGSKTDSQKLTLSTIWKHCKLQYLAKICHRYKNTTARVLFQIKLLLLGFYALDTSFFYDWLAFCTCEIFIDIDKVDNCDNYYWSTIVITVILRNMLIFIVFLCYFFCKIMFLCYFFSKNMYNTLIRARWDWPRSQNFKTQTRTLGFSWEIEF